MVLKGGVLTRGALFHVLLQKLMLRTLLQQNCNMGFLPPAV
jgi:hypothetical protein